MAAPLLRRLSPAASILFFFLETPTALFRAIQPLIFRRLVVGRWRSPLHQQKAYYSFFLKPQRLLLGPSSLWSSGDSLLVVGVVPFYRLAGRQRVHGWFVGVSTRRNLGCHICRMSLMRIADQGLWFQPIILQSARLACPQPILQRCLLIFQFRE